MNAINCMEDKVDVDTWLQQTLAEAASRYPDIGFFFLAVDAEQGQADLSAACNIERSELHDILKGYIGHPKPTVVRMSERAN